METKTLMGLLIAIACLAIFWVAYDKVFHLGINQEYDNAKNALDSAFVKINVLKDGESTEQAVQGFDGSNKWYIFGFGSSKKVSEKPKECLLNNCLCICKMNSGDVVNDCDAAGYCREVKDRDVEVSSVLARDYARDFEGDVWIPKLELNCIALQNNLLAISVKKDDSFVRLSASYGPFLSEDAEYKAINHNYCNVLK